MLQSINDVAVGEDTNAVTGVSDIIVTHEHLSPPYM